MRKSNPNRANSTPSTVRLHGGGTKRKQPARGRDLPSLASKRPTGVTGVGRYQHADSRQVAPEYMPAFTLGYAVKTIADMPRDCKCTWVPRIRRIPESVLTAWEMKFWYALCPAHRVAPIMSS